jgi:hypothetical protein
MKKIKGLFPFFFILILCLVSFRFLFFISYLQIQKSDFRKQLISDRSSEIIQLELHESDLYLDKNDLEWKEKNKELVIHGIYHEVLQIKKVGSKAYITVICDKLENTLFQKYFCLNKSAKPGLEDLVKLFLSLNFTGLPFDFEIKNHFTEYKYAVPNMQILKNPDLLKTLQPPEAATI